MVNYCFKSFLYNFLSLHCTETSSLFHSRNDFLFINIFQNKTKPVKMMYMRKTFPVLIMETMNFKMIELPYVKRELSMFILLPDDIKDNTTGLEQVREHAKTILYYCSVIKKKKKRRAG